MSDGSGVRLRVLGELSAEVDGAPVELGGPRQRAVLGPLVLARGSVVPVDEIVEAVWGDAPPATSTASLHSFVSNLRRALRPASGGQVLVRESVGYALRLPTDAVDAWRFEQLVSEAAALLSVDPASAADRLETALGLWRGAPLLDYRDALWAEPEIARLTALRTVAHEQLLAARLETTEAAVVVPALQTLVDEQPLREERWRLLVLALYRAGRQADALAALRRARQVLSDELGVDPGPALRELEGEVLAQAPSLRPARPAVSAAPPPGAAPSAPRAWAPPAADDELVERDPELVALDRALARAGGGEGRLMLVRGPAGIGKSRLLTEVRRRAGVAGLLVLRARGSELEREFGFGAVRQLFEPLLADPAERERLLQGAAGSSAAVFDLSPGTDTEEPSFATLHGLYWLTVNVAARGPVLLCVDDLHWCDAGSLRFLGYLLRRLEGLPIALLGAVRTGERFPTSALLDEMERDLDTDVLSPGLLTREGVRDVVRQRLGADSDDAFGDVCFDTTSGNPLLLRQLLRALESEGVRPVAASVDRARALGSRAVSSMVLLRLRRLPPAATSAARALAVLGDGAPLPAVAALAELHEVEVAAATDLLSEAEILRPEPPLGFVHALVRDAVYRDLAPGERELAHDSAARLLHRGGAPVEQVAAQLLHAPRRADDWVVDVLRTAAAEAIRRGAPDGASAYLSRALEEPPSKERAEVVFELGQAKALVEGPTALRHLEEAYSGLGDPQRRAAAAVMLARTMVFAGAPGAGSAFAARAAADLGDDLLDARQALVALHRVSGHMHGIEASTWGWGVEPDVVGTGPGARMLQADLAWERFAAGRPLDEVVPLAAEALSDGRLRDADNGLLSIVATFVQDLCDVDVMPIWDDALRSTLARGSLFGLLSVRMWAGMALWRRGDLLEAEDSLRAAIEQLALWQNDVGHAYAESFLVRVLVERGQLDAAEALLARERTLQPRSDGVRLLLEATAELRLAQGRPEEALALLDEADELVAHVVNPAWREGLATRAVTLTALGRSAEAVAVAAGAVERARAFGAPSTTGRFLRVLGVAQGAGGVDALREAVAVLAPTTRRLEHAHALASLADALGTADSAAALRFRRDALLLANECSADALRDRLHGALIAAGVPAQQMRDDLAALTSLERRVARLLALGADSVAVAQALFLTPSAAERQVEQVRGKLAQLAGADA